MAGSAAALERFEGQTAGAMLVLSVLIIPLLVIPLVWELPPGADATILVFDWLIWAAFAVEYSARLYLAPDKGRFVRSNVIDLVMVLVPFLRPLRVTRSLRAVRLLRASRGAIVVLRALKAVRVVLARHSLGYTLLVVAGTLIAGALLVNEFERSTVGSNITSLREALWWATATVTTAGTYGDLYPTTDAGRSVAAVLMVVGLAFFGYVTAALASYLVHRDRTSEPVDLDELRDRLERIEAKLDGLQNGP